MWFGAAALGGALGDWRAWRDGVAGPRRLARHLWRMGVALLIGTMAFFFGQSRVLPEPLRHPAMLAIPVFTVLGAVLYWLLRTRWPRRHPLP